MKLRNQLLALFCLLVFAGFAVLYFRAWVVQKPFAIILFVSDSLLPRHLTAARLYEGGAEHRLALEAFPNVALLNNSARDFAVPDAAAAATALATGLKVNHRTLGLDTRGQRVRTILDLARTAGRSTGLVTNGRLTDAAVAAFYAYAADSRKTAELAQQFGTAPRVDLALGGGAADFQIGTRDLAEELQKRGWELVRTKVELENTGWSYPARPLLGLFSQGPLAFSNEIESGSEQPSLADMVRRAIECLQTSRKGYVLIVDASLVTTAAERNEGERVISETLALDRAIATAVKYAGAKSLIVAVGKYGIGGMSLNGYPLRQDHGVAVLGPNASGQPAITWSTGPNGPVPVGGVPDENAATTTSAKTEPAAFQTPSALNTAEDVIAIGMGPGSEGLRGFQDNTKIFELLKSGL